MVQMWECKCGLANYYFPTFGCALRRKNIQKRYFERGGAKVLKEYLFSRRH